MKLLLDENLPHQMHLEIAGHEVFTAAYMGWSGIENGELLEKVASNGFDELVTNDRGLEYEQNLTSLPLAVVILELESNTLESVRIVYPALLAALKDLKKCQFVKVSGY